MDKFHNLTTEYKVIDHLHDRHISKLEQLYSGEFWCNTRSRQDVEIMLANTDVIIGLEDSTQQLVGFCRLLTDFVYKATLYDLIVDPAYRGRNLGAYLMTLVVEHPRLGKVQHIDLNCLPAMTEFYKRWGFTQELDGLCHMRRFHREFSKPARWRQS